MGFVLATTAGLIVWIVLWALGAKGFDSFLLTLLIMVIAATLKMIAPSLPGNRDN
jgi:hypothetical protein